MAYNEEVGLPFTVLEVIEVLQGIDYEIVIIDDGSSDGTAKVARQLSVENSRVRVVTHPFNQGLGEVYRSGFLESRGEWLSFLPADGELPAQNLESFLAVREDYDLLLGVIPRRDVAKLALILTYCEKLLYRCLFGRIPPFQGLFMIRRTLLESIDLRSAGRSWAVLMELFLKAIRAGCRWRNVDTFLRPRVGGTSKVRNLRTVLSNLFEVLRLRFIL